MENKKTIIDISGLSRYHENLKTVLNTKEAAGAAAQALEDAKKYADEEIAKLSFDEAGTAKTLADTAEQNAKDYADGLNNSMDSRMQAVEGREVYVSETVNQAILDAKNAAIADAADKYQVKGEYEAAGAAAQALEVAKKYVDGKVDGKFDDKGAAAQALEDAKADAANLYQVKGEYEVAGTAAGLNAAMDVRVAKLEAIDHVKLASDASASAVSTILDGAPEKFDTLKEVAKWIEDSETAASAADLVTRVSNLEAIDHEAYISADTELETSLKGYVDGKVDGKFDAAGAAAQALEDAKADAANLYQVKGDYLLEDDLVFATDGDIDGLFA